MQVESKFYQRLHNNDATYGRNAYDVPRLLAALMNDPATACGIKTANWRAHV